MRSDRSVHVCWLWRALVVGIVGLSVVGAAGQEGRQRATSSQSVEKPDYNRVFAMDRVHELRITIPAERFDEMQRDLARIGRGRGRGFGPGGLPAPPPFGMADAAALQEAVIACGGKTVDAECSVRGVGGRCATGPDDSLACRILQGPGRGGFAGPAPAFGQPERMAVRVSVRSSGRTWANVRMRYKGNSSLMGATATGNGKVPFRLEFGSDEPSRS